MENEILLHIEGMTGKECKKKISTQIAKMPGVELIQIDMESGRIGITGGDLDQMHIIDAIEAMGYTALEF